MKEEKQYYGVAVPGVMMHIECDKIPSPCWTIPVSYVAFAEPVIDEKCPVHN